MKEKHQHHKGKTALITGASSGIGLELAKIFAREGYNLVLVARNEESLNKIASQLYQQHGISAVVIAKDLSRQDAPQEIFQYLQRGSIDIDILVNNAGFGTFGSSMNTDLTSELQMMQVNIVTLTHLTKLFLREMVRRGVGKILNVASLAGFQPGPLMAVYYASKAYVLSFSEAIANELNGTGVTVTVLCPGPTETGFQQRAGMERSGLFRRLGVMDAKTVAAIGYRSLIKGKIIVIPGFVNKILAFSSRLLPRIMVTKIVRYLNSEFKKQAS